MTFFGILHLGEEFIGDDGRYPSGAHPQGFYKNTENGWAGAKNNLCKEIGVDPSHCDTVFKYNLDDGTEVRKLVRIGDNKPVTRVR